VKVRELKPEPDWLLGILAEDGRRGSFDVKPYLDLPVFEPLRDVAEFARLRSGGYYVEWACGADLSADTIESHMVWAPRG
jgi:hypothetical protein